MPDEDLTHRSSIPRSEQQERLETAERIVKLFTMERYMYLALSFLTALIVILETAITVHNHDAMSTLGVTLLGSGGVVAFNLGRLLTMFNTVIDRVFGSKGA